MNNKIEHVDERRTRVGRWGFCSQCGEVIPLYLLEVDHREPIVPLHLSLEQMSWDDLIDNLWCEESNLNPICKPCHKLKNRQETKERRKHKNG